MQCFTFDEIALACGCSATQAKELISSEKYLDTKATKPDANHTTDFDIPIYNVWKQQAKTEGSTHFGNSVLSAGAMVTQAEIDENLNHFVHSDRSVAASFRTFTFDYFQHGIFAHLLVLAFLSLDRVRFAKHYAQHGTGHL